jgi:predicted nucleotidyltransferase
MRIAYLLFREKKLKKDVLKIIGKYLDLKKYKIFFFGLKVKGTNSSRSDIDIGIKKSKPISLRLLQKGLSPRSY